MTARLDPTITLISVGWDDPRAVELRRVMDVEIMPRYEGRIIETVPGEIDAALAVNPEFVRATVLALDADGTPIAHAALKDIRGDWEVKRVIVTIAARGRGVGRALMNELEAIARAAGRPRLILQTGDRQPDAVHLYETLGYTPIPAYEPYATAIPFSLCFEKVLD